MTYAELVAQINSIVEDSFPTAIVDEFIRQAEQKIFASVELPALRDEASIPTVSGTDTVALPADFLYPYAVVVIDSGVHYMILNKDESFVREAYPDPTATSRPKHYALEDENTMLLGPTPDAIYNLELRYARFPESIVTAGSTWLGEHFDTALLNGALVEAARHEQLEDDIVLNYDKLYKQAIQLLIKMGDGKMRKDTYRSGQPRIM